VAGGLCTSRTITVDDKLKSSPVLFRVNDIKAKNMYQNKITFEDVTNLDDLIAADKYNIVDLVAKCKKYIFMNLSMRNIL
jgi:hypothetical protein